MTQTEKLTSLGLLAAGVAHEVNTPLAVISNYIQMLAKQMPEGDPRQSIIEKIVKQTFRASEIVNNLLNFSRTGAGEAASVDVNRVVEETLSLVAHPLKTAQIQVVKELGVALPPVHGSANKLQQVFLNRSEEHTSELQSRLHLVCRLLLEKKKKGRRLGDLHDLRYCWLRLDGPCIR